MTHDEEQVGFPGGSPGTHGECWSLLPWIANESAPAKDVTRVEAHLCDCRECQEELEFQRQLRNAIRAEDAVVLAPQTSLQKLMQRIDTVGDLDDEPQPTTPDAVAPPQRKTAIWSRWLPIAAAVQGIMIAALLAGIWMQSDALTAPRYVTRTASDKTITSRPVIRVVFTDDVALDDVNRVLRSVDAQIISGPSEAGVYTLGAARFDQQSSVDKALEQLRADGQIVFAEPADEYEAP